MLVTDYSSVMFDFAVTGKPIVFFTYDLDHYRDVLRGFYFDLPRARPARCSTTSEQVVDALADLRRGRRRHARALRAVPRAVLRLEDGHATERVVDRFFRAPVAGPLPVTTAGGASATVAATSVVAPVTA